MRRKMQEGDALQIIYDDDLGRRVSFFENSDGTFGFLEWKFAEPEDSWIATRGGQGSRLSTLEDAVREASMRIECLADVTNS
jgi:hypothetical protein